MTVSETQLQEHRRHAAAASGGTSIEPVYRLVMAETARLGLGGRVLDFGAGTGTLTRMLLDSGRFDTVHGADIMSRPADLADPVGWLAQDLNAALEAPDRSFDAIVSAEVIEHLENPRAVARDWFRLLSPGGTLLMTTPNNESVRSVLTLLVKGHYAEFDDTSYPAHITALLRKDIVRLLDEAGFRDVRFAYTDRGRIPKRYRTTWQHVSGGVLRGVRFSDNLLAAAVKPAEAA